MTQDVSKCNDTNLQRIALTGYAALVEKPLLGAVLCCTSIAPEDRTLLAQYAEQMGAEHKLDLTSDVTHLLVGATDTPKYQYVAREREDVKVLRPEWVEAVRECWMEDRPIDMNTLEAEYRVSTLAGLKICITGFDDLTFRAQLQKNVLSHGGQYTGDLTKDVTHLIAAKAEGKKYDYATLWQKKVVSLQWYKDSLERGMQLDESCYHPARPVHEQGMGAWNREMKKQSIMGKRARDEQSAPAEPTRKLRRVASAKLGSETESIWGDIVRPPSQQSLRTREDDSPSTRTNKAQQEKQQGEQKLGDDPTKLTRSNGEGFLNGLNFVIMKFEKRKETLISQTLQAAGAAVETTFANMGPDAEADASNAFVIVPHQAQPNEVPLIWGPSITPTIVTELWLERCMLQKSLISPSDYPLGGLITRITSPEINLLTVNATGFQSIETLHIAKTVALAGAQYAEVFTAKSSVLVCNSLNVNKQKVFHAEQWNIPVVTEGWLCQFLTGGTVPDFGDYSIKGGERDQNDLEAELKHKRALHHENVSRRVDVDDEKLSNAASKQSMSVQPPSAKTFVPTPSTSQERRDQRVTKGNGLSSQDQPPSNRHEMAEQNALREISPNSPFRRNKAVSTVQKSLFQAYDGNRTTMDTTTNDPQIQLSGVVHGPSPTPSRIPDAASMNSAIDDFLNMQAKAKAKAKANASVHSDAGKSKKNRLLDRALSNLSNASHASRHSRASSVDSLNTDGVGSEIGPLSHPTYADGTAAAETKRVPFLHGQVHDKSNPSDPTDSANHNISPSDPADPTLSRDGFGGIGYETVAPQMTQLGYEDSAEAIALREKLAEKRRARARLGQNSSDANPEIDGKEREALKQQQQQQQQQREKDKRVIKDDDTLASAGWGGGRRTRAKNRSADMGELGLF